MSLRDFFLKRHGIDELIMGFLTKYRLCMIVFIVGILARYLYKIPVLDNLDVLHNMANRINEVYMQVLTIEDNVLTQIFQVFENITHYAKEDIFALTVMIGCFWLVLCKGLLWGPAVIFLIYNGSGLLPFLVVAFIIDLIINRIISTTKSKKNNKKGPDETDMYPFHWMSSKRGTYQSKLAGRLFSPFCRDGS